MRRSKVDQKGSDQVVGIAHGTFAETDPFAALVAWSTVRDKTLGALFTRI
ncbi:hypothetical protein K3U93_06225 [Mycobacterium malmoense]|nr:hypothetical protein [Mycobacterium malmoense]QZA18764.1 hypothetical protein K3U93_06225 [Mycobacterium malmoense]UNB95535.1 hypothetical protein H5T25_06220 [Mycobacterium malmoense]